MVLLAGCPLLLGLLHATAPAISTHHAPRTPATRVALNARCSCLTGSCYCGTELCCPPQCCLARLTSSLLASQTGRLCSCAVDATHDVLEPRESRRWCGSRVSPRYISFAPPAREPSQSLTASCSVSSAFFAYAGVLEQTTGRRGSGKLPGRRCGAGRHRGHASESQCPATQKNKGRWWVICKTRAGVEWCQLCSGSLHGTRLGVTLSLKKALRIARVRRTAYSL